MALTERYVTATGTDTYANSTNIATPMSFATAIANAVAGDRINIKVGTYARTTTTDTVTNSGTVTSPIIFRGYSSAIGDGNLGRTNGNGALITTNMPSITYTSGRMNTTATFILWESINVSGASTVSQISVTANSAARNCKSVNSSIAAGALGMIATSANSIVFDCDLELSGASGGSAALSCTTRALCNRIKGGQAVGLLTNQTAAIIGNVIFASTGNHISMNSTSGAPCIFGNTLVGGGADAINIVTATTVLQCIVGNMITDNTGDGIDMVSTANAAFAAYNRTRDNANAINNGGDWLTATTYAHVTADTGGPETDYVASGSNDYRLIRASPAREAGWFPFSSIGALQRASVPRKIPTIG